MTFSSFSVAPRGVVLFDRDGTLVHDVAYNRDPALVAPVEGAARAVARLRAAGIGVGVATNQGMIGDGRATRAEVDAVNARVDDLIGPFDAWFVCPHGRDEGCDCRKPAPGLVRQAQRFFGVEADRVVLIGDIGSDVTAAESAGSRGILVPTPATRAAEVDAAALVASDLEAAVERALELLDAVEVAR